jgi:hypothetical protein
MVNYRIRPQRQIQHAVRCAATNAHRRGYGQPPRLRRKLPYGKDRRAFSPSPFRNV